MRILLFALLSGLILSAECVSAAVVSGPSHEQLKAYFNHEGWCELDKTKFQQFSDIPGDAIISTKFGVTIAGEISKAGTRAAAREALLHWKNKSVSIWKQCAQ